jgi:molybdate transport system substrate-binding protein
VKRAACVAALAAALATAACSGGSANGAGSDQTVRVYAASSLTEAFTALARSFEDAHPGVRVALTFGASSSLVTQVEEGAPADVLATADGDTMEEAVAAGAAEGPTAVARNRLTILVEPGNPRRVRALADLADPDLTLVLCAVEVPCGRLAAAALEGAGVDATPRSLEENVKGVVAKVILGEADAGLVYETDARAVAGRADAVAFAGADDPSLQATATAAVVASSARRPLARSWIRFVTSATGRKTLTSLGFRAP